MRSMRALSTGFGSVVVSLTVATAALAQAPAGQAPAPGAQGQGGRGGQPPPPPQNLQILPKDIPRPELLATMRGYAAALGVMCNYCHIQEGQGGRNDMASDEKTPKKTARVMMQLTARVNEQLATGLGKTAADVTKVQCWTCHRGKAIPENPPPPPPPAQAPGGGAGAAPGH